jgi:hypothetical protein
MFSTGTGHAAVDRALLREPGRIADYATHPGAELAAFGWPMLTGLQNSPDLALFRFLAPDSPGLTEEVYNRYAHYTFVSTGKSDLPSADSMRVAISPCSRRLAALGVNHLLADASFQPDPGCAAAWRTEPAGELRLWSRRVPVCNVGVARGAPASVLDFDYGCPGHARFEADTSGFSLRVPADPSRSWAMAVNPAVIGSLECTGATARFVGAHLVVHPEGLDPRCRARYLDSIAALRRLLRK